MKTGFLFPVFSFRNNKGWLRIIEIALAATLVFSFFMFINKFEGGFRSSRPETDKYLLQQLGEDALRSYDLVDANGNDVSDLRWEILTNDWTDIGEQLNTSLGRGVGYALYFYNSTAGYTSDQIRFVTGSTAKPINRDVASVYYIIAGDDALFCSAPSACALKLDLWYIK